jgi:hypothetical protein
MIHMTLYMYMYMYYGILLPWFYYTMSRTKLIQCSMCLGQDQVAEKATKLTTFFITCLCFEIIHVAYKANILRVYDDR